MIRMHIKERNNPVRFIIALCLCMSALSARETVTGSFNSIPDTINSSVSEPESQAIVAPPPEDLTPPIARSDSSTVIFLPADTSAATPDLTGPISANEPELAVHVPKPRLMVLYAGELDSISYEQVIKEVKYNNIESPIMDSISVVTDTVARVTEATVSIETLLPMIYNELSQSADMPVVSLAELTSRLPLISSADEGCLSDSCQQKLAAALDVTHVLTWKLSQRREVLKITLSLKPVGGKSIGKAVYYYRGNLSGLMKNVRRACWTVNNKPVPKELVTNETGFQRMILMTDYYLGMNNTLIGAGALSAAGLAVFLMRNGHKNEPPGIEFPPDWPGEEQ